MYTKKLQIKTIAVLLGSSLTACGDDTGADDGGSTGDQLGSTDTSPASDDASASAGPTTDSDRADSSSSGDVEPGDCTPSGKPVAIEQRPTGATVEVYDRCGLTVHAYIAPEAAAGNGVHILETENQLVVIDTHFIPAISLDFRDYAEGLGKPIDRVIVTQEHPDHWAGLGSAFSDVPAFAAPGVVTALHDGGLPAFERFAGSNGTATPSGFAVPTQVQDAGIEMIDGVMFEFVVMEDNEADDTLVVSLPEHGVAAVGDLIYNGYHGVLTPNFDGWIEAVEQIEAMGDVDFILAGHGSPGSTSIATEMIAYLESARTLFETNPTPEQYQAQMNEAYPGRLDGEGLFWALSLQRLFPPDYLRLVEDDANAIPTLAALRKTGDYAEPNPADGFIPKNCVSFPLTAEDLAYTGYDEDAALHEVCLDNTYTSLKHRLVTVSPDPDEEPAEADLYARHRPYVDRFKVGGAEDPREQVYALSCQGSPGDCTALFSSNPPPNPDLGNVGTLFGDDSTVRLSLEGGGWIDIAFFVPRAGPTSLIPHEFFGAQLPNLDNPAELLQYDTDGSPIGIPEVEYPRGNVTNDTAFGFSCEIAEGAQHEAQRYLNRYRKAQADRVGDDAFVHVVGLLNAEYGIETDADNGYFSLHVLWTPTPENAPAAATSDYYLERLVIPKQQGCSISSIGLTVDIPREQAEALVADADGLTAFLEAAESEVAP